MRRIRYWMLKKGTSGSWRRSEIVEVGHVGRDKITT